MQSIITAREVALTKRLVIFSSIVDVLIYCCKENYRRIDKEEWEGLIKKIMEEMKRSQVSFHS